MRAIYRESLLPLVLPLRRLLGGCLVAAALAAATAGAQVSQPAPAPGGADVGSALRYVSLRSSKVYLRKGPGTDYPIARVYERAGLPVEVIREFDVWRQVRDAGGIVGWVHSALLSGRRTALVLPWEAMEVSGEGQQASQAILRETGSPQGRPLTQLERGALVGIVGCANGWCLVSLGSQRGYIEQTKLWGTYPNETIK